MRVALHSNTVRKRMMPVVGSGEGVSSFVHIDDAVDATVRAIERECSGIFNVCDDHPVAQHVWLPELARLLGAKPPRRAPAWLVGLLGGATAKFHGTALRGASSRDAQLAIDDHSRGRGRRSPRYERKQDPGERLSRRGMGYVQHQSVLMKVRRAARIGSPAQLAFRTAKARRSLDGGGRLRALAQYEFLNLASRSLGQYPEHDALRQLEAG
jgi:hypothetical protein